MVEERQADKYVPVRLILRYKTYKTFSFVISIYFVVTAKQDFITEIECTSTHSAYGVCWMVKNNILLDILLNIGYIRNNFKNKVFQMCFAQCSIFSWCYSGLHCLLKWKSVYTIAININGLRSYTGIKKYIQHKKPAQTIYR